ncbi:VPLPA-CTERM sorting domain-containing protein [Litorivita sp. NS0012-18]|uniref:VPLPA-CTERM sorting domain-containing protein n=1 Tax=Litorivita sp. NS0012-18 TaxID=3127655 RepID=UPI0031046632
MKRIIGSLVLAGTVAAAGLANAATYTIEYTSTVETGLAGYFEAGDTVTVSLLADNGGSSISTVFTDQDFLSTTITIGSYSAYWGAGTEYTFGGNTGVTRFSTDAGGNISGSSTFYGSFTDNGVDNFGASAYHYNTGLGVSGGSNFGFADPYSEAGNWSISEAAPAVPLPAAMPLLLVGLGALGFTARRKKAA